MTQPLPDPVFVILCDDEGAGRIVVDLEAFVRYGTQLDVSLAALEAKWSHLAPAIKRRSLRRSDKSA
ncbi:MAG TPA: hypothetical protein VMP01_03370 [Pirellulaceae bacterium]|nr:hypothetical protein [Pirellulaceae bacterium]